MRSEWRLSTINEICSLVTDGAHNSPKSVINGAYMASVKDFTEYGLDFSSCRMISEEDYEKLRLQGCVPEFNDILVGKDGARYFEDIIIYKQPEKPALLSSIAILRTDRKKVIPEFLYYTLKSPSVRKDVRDNYGSGSAIPRIVLKDFKRMPIAFPPIDEQKKLVSIFVSIDVRLTNQGGEKKISLPEMNARINELLKQSIKSDGVINLFSDVNTEFSLFDPKFLEEISKMKEKNLAVELLKKLIAEQVSIYRRTNVVKSEKFSEIMQRAMNSYLNGMLTNEQVIEEMMKLAKQIAAAQKEGEKLGLTADELAFYDALTKPQAIKDFYENEELIAITKELAETLRKNRTIDWQKRDSARAKMRMMIKKLLKKHKYPPEGMDDAVQTVMTQCELWTDNADFF